MIKVKLNDQNQTEMVIDANKVKMIDDGYCFMKNDATVMWIGKYAVFYYLVVVE